MTNCSHCGSPGSKGIQLKQVIALYHEVEIMHSVCPQCVSVHFPKFYKIREVETPAYQTQLNAIMDEHEPETADTFGLLNLS